MITSILNKVKNWKINSNNLDQALDKVIENSKNENKAIGFVFIFDDKADSSQNIKIKIDNILNVYALEWQRNSLLKNEKEFYYFNSVVGPVWILRYKEKKSTHGNLFSESLYAWSRENIGSLYSHFKIHLLKDVFLFFNTSGQDSQLGAMLGIEMAQYNFKNSLMKKEELSPSIYISNLVQETFKEAKKRSSAVNMCRHLVNLPPNLLGPQDFVQFIKDQNFGKNTKIEIWDKKKLIQEKMNLLLAVGQGSAQDPTLIKITYKSKNTKVKSLRKKYAFVGKGITFDTGGLDIKPSSGMRLMKKDMGGAAAVTALAYYISQNDWNFDFDFYIALAENSVDAKSFRPSDVIQSRSGLWVEIDNTDAEGRLVLADALDLATQQTENIEAVINIATLTGAIKVALGSEVAGLFSNDDELSEKLMNSSQNSGDLCWRMPLVDKYFSSLSSPFADFKNSAEGFGGAITAALFLQKFVNQKKWAHLDIYAWNDKSSGSLSFAGGSGQSVQLMIEFVNSLK